MHVIADVDSPDCSADLIDYDRHCLQFMKVICKVIWMILYVEIRCLTQEHVCSDGLVQRKFRMAEKSISITQAAIGNRESWKYVKAWCHSQHIFMYNMHFFGHKIHIIRVFYWGHNVWLNLGFYCLDCLLCPNCNNKDILCCWSWIVTIIISIFVEMSRNFFCLNLSFFIRGWHDTHLPFIIHILHFHQNLKHPFTRNACGFNSMWQPWIYWIFSSFFTEIHPNVGNSRFWCKGSSLFHSITM